MGWCDEHYHALFMIIHNKPWLPTPNALYHVFCLFGVVENIDKCWTMGEFPARVNFCSPTDVVNAFCKLQASSTTGKHQNIFFFG